MAIILTAYQTSLEVTQGEHVLEGGIRANDVEYRFPEGDQTWAGMALVGCFETILGTWGVVLDQEHRCKIPWEALGEGSAGSYLNIGLYGVKEDDGSVIVRSTVWAKMPFRILPGPDAKPAQDPTPSQYQQMLAGVSKVATQAEAILKAEKEVTGAAVQIARMRDEVSSDTRIVQNAVPAVQAAASSALNSAQSASLSEEEAKKNRIAAEAAVGKTSYIGENLHWYEWDAEAGCFVDTGISASLLLDENSGKRVRVWFGTIEEYNALPKIEDDVYYNILDGRVAT